MNCGQNENLDISTSINKAENYFIFSELYLLHCLQGKPVK